MSTVIGGVAETEAGDGEAGISEAVDFAAVMQSDAFRRDPYPTYARMRAECPMYRAPQGVWYVTRHADVEQALGDLRLSNDRERMTGALVARDGRMRDLSRLTARLGRVMSNTDPPDHARLRGLVNKAFTARRVEELRGRIQTVVDRLVDDAVAGEGNGNGEGKGKGAEPVDLLSAVASPLPHTVVCELFGIPEADRERVKEWFRGLGRIHEDIERAERVVDEFEAYLTGLARQRRAAPGDDLISALVTAQARGDRLTDHELLSTCFMLITAGDETTTNLIGNGVLALLRHPDQLARLRAEPTLIRTAVDEIVRYDSPSQAIVRVAAEDVPLGGRTVPAGDLVYLLLASAGRDPDRHQEPDRLDLTRPAHRHLGFGHGPHFCLGAPLARLEAELAIGTLVRRLPSLRLAVPAAELQWRPNPLQRRLTALPVLYTDQKRK
ncbi:cytochrome P450 [Streptomyces sp. NBC_01275]|uniref:cytochrome P450 family protein n=1 Tax=Streptomyces sp. NBC_01275 TaxID=2903807 RepID=UPI00224DF2F0|nr:cytochrome P450 [Streptomyces sp. NBC_01275]MCX4765824.1 cytochrome P450 [Streptomyces sp. NBC_01275]